MGMYEMPDEKYESYWKDLQSRVFRLEQKIPDQVFHEDFQLAFCGFPGIHFDEEFYVLLQRVLADLGEDQFALVGDPDSAPRVPSRFVYPSDLEWLELTEGKGIQHFHLNYSDK